MAVRSSRPSFVARAAATAVVAAALTATAPATATAGTTGLLDLVCAQRLLQEPTRLATALEHGVSALLVSLLNDLTGDELAHLAADDTTWLDECGQVFVADHAIPQAQQVTAEAAPAEGVPADVFALSSRPGSTRTIYLDFDGATYSGTRWKDGAEIVSPAYSIDADRTTFDATERAQVYLAWRTVAEDFAPFDVNVTTQRPDPSALSRTTSTDQTYGIPVVVTPTNSVGSGCGCGGISYTGVFGAVGATAYQPAWIFTSGSGTGGYDVGQIISHEVGHTFGLSHDGTAQGSYYAGAKGWAPIMGSSYGKRASHWSSGEYAGANNPEDDTAVIARTAPVLADDHANGVLGASRLTAGTTASGVITTRTDTDAFTFSASGRTALSVAGPAGLGNLDVRLTILDALRRRRGHPRPDGRRRRRRRDVGDLGRRPAEHPRDLRRGRRRHRVRHPLGGRPLQRLRVPRRVRRDAVDRWQHGHAAAGRHPDVDRHRDVHGDSAVDRVRHHAPAGRARRCAVPRHHPVQGPGVGGTRRLAPPDGAAVGGRR